MQNNQFNKIGQVFKDICRITSRTLYTTIIIVVVINIFLYILFVLGFYIIYPKGERVFENGVYVGIKIYDKSRKFIFVFSLKAALKLIIYGKVFGYPLLLVYNFYVFITFFSYLLYKNLISYKKKKKE